LLIAITFGISYGSLVSEGSAHGSGMDGTPAGPLTGLLMVLFLLAMGVLIINTLFEGTVFVEWAPEEVNCLRIATAALVYYATLFWVTGWHTVVWGLVLPCFAALLAAFGVPYLYKFLDARHRGIPNTARQRAGIGGSSTTGQIMYILRLEAVLVGRWSCADAQGFVACCAAAAWLCAAFGPCALPLVAAWAVLTATVPKLVGSLSDSWSVLKPSWEMVSKSAQDSQWVCADAGFFLLLVGSSVSKYGGCWHVTHYVGTIFLVLWLCTYTSRCAAMLSRLLNIAADKAQWHLPTGALGDRVLMRWAAFSCFLTHMLCVCCVYPWLVVPFIGLGAVLSSGMRCTCECRYGSRCSCRNIFAKFLAGS
jgi:hypothetical protein